MAFGNERSVLVKRQKNTNPIIKKNDRIYIIGFLPLCLLYVRCFSAMNDGNGHKNKKIKHFYPLLIFILLA
ncbi:hypothetical protein B4168_3089 [Anoxybacillus flavithermus]|nr:hypothetical protein GT20_2790 [Parageobacillus thermoglucosidasius TNO-09.020]KYD15629.1 hypothetical protein B4168_3089 [Anoxybacillus flavithermus]OAO86376.1 hypothetical protein GT23_2269 [Parageobacillus thermoglucosidasius]